MKLQIIPPIYLLFCLFLIFYCRMVFGLVDEKEDYGG